MVNYEDIPYEQLPGAHIEKHLDGYSKNIKSKNIISFEYNCGDFSVSALKKENGIHIISKGGYSNYRDGKNFIVDYVYDSDVMERIMDLIDKYNISSNNGYVEHVNGLPEGLGDFLSVKFDSDEAIYITSNQHRVLIEDAIKAIYELFHSFALENNLDFNSNGSNVKLYDDADNDYLQGVWCGTHFGDKFVVEFNGNHVKIIKNGIVDDDVDYSIFEGNIRTNKLKDGVSVADSADDYLEFNTISCMKKNNDIIITAYFMKNSYSTCDLLRQK